MWPHFDYGYILYDQACKVSFQQKLESIQYACFPITGTIGGISKERLYQELGLESLQLRGIFYKKLGIPGVPKKTLHNFKPV